MIPSDSSETFLYIITQGWKSGQRHEIEIWYVDYRDNFYIVGEGHEKSHWIQNIQHNPAVQVRVGKEGHWQSAQGRIIRPETEPELAAEISRLMDAKYNWSEGLIVEIHPQL